MAMMIRRNDPSQNAQVVRQKSDQGAQVAKDATSVEREKAVREKQATVANTGMSVEQERFRLEDVVGAPASVAPMNTKAASEETHDPMVRLQKSIKEENIKKGLKNLEIELKDYQKQVNVLIKEYKRDDFTKLFEKMDSKLKNTIKLMEKDFPEQTKIIDSLKKSSLQIFEQYVEWSAKEMNEVKEIRRVE